MSSIIDTLRHSTVPINGVQLHLVEAGPADGTPVILLHGFPEFWYGWRHQVGPLADAGFRVIVPDQRGFATSEKPAAVSAYSIDTLADDVRGLIDWTGRPRVAVIGHDWGGVVAWWTAIRHPERVERLAALNGPNPIAFKRQLRSSFRQVLKSWYTYFFRIPWLPEALLRQGNWRMLTRSLRESSRPGTFTDQDLEQYRRAWSEPGAITAMINWYRAMAKYPPAPPSDPRIHVPVLILWGLRDQFLSPEIATLSQEYCDQGRLEFLEEATHWVQHEEPARVNSLLLEFLRKSD